MPENDFSQDKNQPNIASTGPSLFTVIQTRRIMKGYNITEEELKNVGFLNVFSTIFFSVGAIFLTLFIEKLISCIDNGDFQKIVHGAAPILFLLFMVFYAVAIIAIVQRGSTIKRIKDQSETLN